MFGDFFRALGRSSQWQAWFFAMLIIFALMPTSLHAQYNLPELGDASREAFSPYQERKMGEDIIRELRANGTYMNDPEVNDYLNTLGHRLVSAINDTRQEFEFFAVYDTTVNAFALPGGFIGVNTGLITLVQNESELASVLAHEITHVTQYHLARMISGQKDQLLLSLAALAVAAAAAGSNSSSGDQMIGAAVAGAQALAIQSQINYTREHEYEADRIGFQRLRAAGFDVNASATLMERMLRANRFNDGTAPSYLRTHPVTTERIAEAQARAEGVPYKQVVDSIDFHFVRALLQSYAGTGKEAVARFDEALRTRKFNNEAATHYGLAASLLRTKEFDRAKEEIAWLDRTMQHPMIDAMAGHILMESGALDEAIQRFDDALKRYPNKKQLVYDYPEALLKAGRARDAAQYLESTLTRFPSDGQLHEKAARAYAKLNIDHKQHYHLGEYYVWRGAYQASIEQFELVLKDKDASFQELSITESRLRTVRQEQADEKELAKKN
jgi:Putative Zn-dependent protease, contains TPR repeats